MKRQNGITLIALAITIVVLLILVGVSITSITEDDGIITKANEAKDETLASQKQEESDIDEIYDFIDENSSTSITEQPDETPTVTDTTAPTATLSVVEGYSSSFQLTTTVALSNVASTDYPITLKYYLDGTLKATQTITSGTSDSYIFLDIGYSDHTVKVIVSDTSGNSSTTEYEYVYVSCFLAGTKVLTETGFKNIEDIVLGEKVYSINLDNNQRELSEVTKLYNGTTTEVYEITIGDTVTKATPRHQFYIIDKGWIRAFDLQVGDKISSKDNDLVINKIEYKSYEEEIPVYNLTVDGNHNYLITENELLVHNTGSPT